MYKENKIAATLMIQAEASN